MTIAEKLITIADNTPLVAEAVNAARKEKADTAFRVDGALEMKVFSAPTATVRIYGRNLLNIAPTQYSGAYASGNLTEDGLVVTAKRATTYISANYLIPQGENLVGKKVTVSGQWEASGGNNGAARLIWTGKDNIHSAVGQIGGLITSGKSVTLTITAKPETAGQLCLFLYGNYSGTAAVGDTVTYRNIQVELGEGATDYEAYKTPQQVQSPEDGSAVQPEALWPTMTVLSEGPDLSAYGIWFPQSAADTYESYQKLKAAMVL